MTIDDWILQCRQEASAHGDRERERLYNITYEAWGERENNPQRSLALYEEGSRLAQLLEEPWWRLYYDDWQVNALLFWIRDYGKGLDLAVRNMLESRKPLYSQYPGRYNLAFNLVDAYLGVDPHGYLEPINEALTFLRGEALQLQGADLYRLLKSECSLAMLLDDLSRGEERALTLLQRVEEDVDTSRARFHATFAHGTLCTVAWERKEVEHLLEWARIGETQVESNWRLARAGFWAWEAVALRHRGEEERARLLVRRALSRIKGLSIRPHGDFFHALSHYHELVEDWARSLRIRQRQLETLVGTGRHHAEAMCRVRICRLLARLKRPLRTEAQAARTTILKLRFPEARLAELEEAIRGEV